MRSGRRDSGQAALCQWIRFFARRDDFDTNVLFSIVLSPRSLSLDPARTRTSRIWVPWFRVVHNREKSRSVVDRTEPVPPKWVTLWQRNRQPFGCCRSALISIWIDQVRDDSDYQIETRFFDRMNRMDRMKEVTGFN
jgi:hypothetical protein